MFKKAVSIFFTILFLGIISAPSIIVSIDGDDWFKHDNVLTKLNEVYNSGDVWMTYGTYEEYPYRDVTYHYHEYPQDIIKTNSFRE